MVVWLVGQRGVGKTTTAGLVAGRLGWDTVDTDRLIERRAGTDITTVRDTEGETVFRSLETAVIRGLTRNRDGDGGGLVVATGGGACLRAENRGLMKASGTVIYIYSADLNVGSGRTARHRTYARLADITVTRQNDPDGTATVTVGEIRWLLTAGRYSDAAAPAAGS